VRRKVSVEHEIADGLRSNADLSSVASLNEKLFSPRMEHVFAFIPAATFNVSHVQSPFGGWPDGPSPRRREMMRKPMATVAASFQKEEAQQEARKPIERDWQMITCLESGSGRGAKDSPKSFDRLGPWAIPAVPRQAGTTGLRRDPNRLFQSLTAAGNKRVRLEQNRLPMNSETVKDRGNPLTSRLENTGFCIADDPPQ
jgi:hypothetical protein